MLRPVGVLTLAHRTAWEGALAIRNRRGSSDRDGYRRARVRGGGSEQGCLSDYADASAHGERDPHKHGDSYGDHYSNANLRAKHSNSIPEAKHSDAIPAAADADPGCQLLDLGRWLAQLQHAEW